MISVKFIFCQKEFQEQFFMIILNKGGDFHEVRNEQSSSQDEEYLKPTPNHWSSRLSQFWPDSNSITSD